MIWLHVSTEIEYRTPLGALRTGEAVRLSLAAAEEPADREKQDVEWEKDYEVGIKLLDR